MGSVRFPGSRAKAGELCPNPLANKSQKPNNRPNLGFATHHAIQDQIIPTSVPRSGKSSPNDGMTVLKGNQPMSDLIVRSNSASPSGDKSTNPSGVGIPQNGDQIEFKDILRILRRRKLVFVTAGAVLLSLVNAVYQRNVNPIYAGSFTLLISDPLSDESAAGISEGSGVFERLARNNTQNDIPTLIEVLRSSLFLEPVAKQLNTSAELLHPDQNSSGRRQSQQARGILKVTVTGRKPEETRRVLQMVSTSYLQAAREQRQQRLSDGLNFLNQQAPELEARTRELQDQIAQFQVKNGLLQPTKEGSDIKQAF